MLRWLGLRYRAPTPRFLRAWIHMRALIRVWAEFIVATAIFSILFVPLANLIIIAILLTLALPIVLLIIWGHSLDDELGWQDRIGR